MNALLLATLLVPLAGIAVLYLVPRRTAERIATRLGFYTGAVVLLLTVVLACLFRYSKTGYQGRVDWNWIPALHIRFQLGVDGISLPLVLLTSLLSALCFFYSIRHVPDGGSQAVVHRLAAALEVGMLGTFLAADLILFFVFFEIVLLPM